MRKQAVETAAWEVASQIRTVEEQIEEAIAQLAELQTRMIRARATANVNVALGHEALAKVASSLTGMVSARGDIALAHAILKETAQHVPGLRTVSFGDTTETPPPTQGVADLRVVA
ncbi:hypothetical protein [Sphingomicrobium nitratireducens]|uniref:hypothetical protein n=1 Tax=Sphingomicrobium nitratireducens TaxID=2964666 RepID=UPI00223FCFAB|nr:hypothetical protein [Sphingomicrobium nitratireducens]